MRASVEMNTPFRFLPELVGFAVLLLVAWRAQWTPGELAWGLWTAGFVLASIWLLVMTAMLVKQEGFGALKTGGTLLVTGLMAWVVVWLYRFYGDLLDLAFPLMPDPGRIFISGATWRNVRPFEFWLTLATGLQHFYVVAVVSLLPLAAGVWRAWPDSARFRTDPAFGGGSFVRLHVTVMLLIALQIFLGAGRPAFVFSVAILAINYFPWQRLVPHKTR